MTLETVLLLGNFTFTCGAYIYTWVVERRVSNDHEHRLRKVEKAVGLREDE